MVVCADLGCSGCCARLPEIRNEARSRPGAPGTVYFISGAFILLLEGDAPGTFLRGTGSLSASVGKRPGSTLTRLCRQYSEGVRVWLWN